MGLVMSPGAVMGQLDEMNSKLNQSLENAEETLSAITELVETEDGLKGDAYDSLREYYYKMHLPVLRGFIMHMEDTIQENYQYRMCIESHLSGISYVDEDALEEDLEKLRTQMDHVRGILGQKNPPNSLYGMLDVMERTEELIEKKLEQISDFLGASAGIYAGIESLEIALMRGIECLHGAVFDGKVIRYNVEAVDPAWIVELENICMEKEIKEKEVFVRALQEEFGFDTETSQILCNLYCHMQEQDVEDINQKYFAILASYGYGRTTEFNLKNNVWEQIAGTHGEGALNEILAGYGLTAKEIEKLEGQISDNHQLSCKGDNDSTNNYYLKNDLSHMAVISATMLNDYGKGWKFAGGFAGWLCNGIFNLEANAGYVGDVYGTAGNGPKLTQDDYRADLDAVNLCSRLAVSKNGIAVIGQYYSGIKEGETNRADEFIINLGDGDYRKGLELLQSQADDNREHLKYNPAGWFLDMGTDAAGKVISGGGISLGKDIYKEQEKIQRNFYRSILEGSDQYLEMEAVDVGLAEIGERQGKDGE